MKQNKILSIALTAAMFGAIVLSGCNNKPVETTVGTTVAPTATETEVAATDSASEEGVITDENGAPMISINFDGEVPEGAYVARGDVSLSIEDVNDAKALLVSGRTDNWNGVNFPCDFFAGNVINVSTRCMCAGGGVRISLQYDTFGTTTYSTICDIPNCDTDFNSGAGTIEIPGNATNVYVYVEGLDVSDIYVDSMTVSVNGEYVDPASLSEVTLVDTSAYPQLKDLYEDYFKIGCAIPASMATNENTSFIDLVAHEFNSVTLENEMKPENILDTATNTGDPATYNESPAVDFSKCKDALDYCYANGIQVRGHVLIWYSQTPDWLFYENYDVNGELASRELMLTRMENYIKSVLTYIDENYPGMFYAFDVVNEAVDDNYQLRDCLWLQTIGDDYIEKAFEFARKYAGEGVDLFYNDYNEYVAAKQEKILEVLRPIAEAGNIDGFGMQSHINTTITVDKYIEVLKTYSDELGVKIHITELDIKQSSGEFGEYKQGLFYQSLFEGLIAAKNEGYPIESVTVWGLTDDISWRANEMPLLFNGDLSIKDAFTGVCNAVTGDTLPEPEGYAAAQSAASAPINEDFEGASFIGGPRYNSVQTIVTTDAYEGSQCLENSLGDAEYDGYSIDISGFCGQTINYSFAVKTDAERMHLTADIQDEWPWLEDIDTSSGEWIYVEGTYEVPDLDGLTIYFETEDMNPFLIDSIHIEAAG